jgi:hypothetical protein
VKPVGASFFKYFFIPEKHLSKIMKNKAIPP